MEYEDYLKVPLIALSTRSKNILAIGLNATKIIPSPSGLPRDWRGLADIAGCTTTAHFGCPDPFASVLVFWQSSHPTMGQLVKALKELDRYDVLDDVSELLVSNAKSYQERQLVIREQPTFGSDNNDGEILTIDDVLCIESSGKPQYYDAFLLYDNNDEEFAMTILDKLENGFKLKLCTKERDLVGGLSFEHEAIMQLIKYRCGRLIVVVSPEFLNSPANHFLLTFAQALGIEQRQRKIIPCVYKNFELPLQLRYYFVLNFSRSTKQWNFWLQLSQSVKATNHHRVIAGQKNSETIPISFKNSLVECITIKEVLEDDKSKFEPQKNFIEPSLCRNTGEKMSSEGEDDTINLQRKTELKKLHKTFENNFKICNGEYQNQLETEICLKSQKDLLEQLKVQEHEQHFKVQQESEGHPTVKVNQIVKSKKDVNIQAISDKVSPSSSFIAKIFSNRSFSPKPLLKKKKKMSKILAE